MPLINDTRLRVKDLQDLRTIRDELKLHIHLGSMEARETFQMLEDKLQTIQNKLPQREDIESIMDDARAHITSATPEMLTELKSGYGRLRDEIKSRMTNVRS